MMPDSGYPTPTRPWTGRTRGLVSRGAWALLGLTWALATASAQAQLPDLRVRLAGPQEAMAGSDVGPKLRIVVSNAGGGPAPGTETGGNAGYMVDLFLTRDAMPEGYASYSEHYHDGVLLRGGRISNTTTLKPGDRRGYGSGAGLPADTPAGRYRLCARVDPGHAIAESNEGNNVACTVLKVARLEVAPMPAVAVAGTAPTAPGPQRSVLPDGTLQIRQPDGTLRQRRPDGKVVTVYPDGRTMVPYAMQVQPADLPPLPSTLADWGTRVNTELLNILRGLLTEAEYQAYLQTEQGKSFYELVDWRLRSIGFLTTAP